jgi:prefoldin subunit 5
MTNLEKNFVNLAEAIKGLKAQVSSLTKERDKWEKSSKYFQKLRREDQRANQEVLKLVSQKSAEIRDLNSQLSNRDKEIKEIKELKEKLSCPDHYYDPFDWEYTLPIGDKEYLKDHLDTQPDSYIVEIATLINGPRRFYVAPDDDVFFNSEQEALASLNKSKGEA